MHLKISDSLKLPSEALTETFAVLGKRGSGKTNFAVVLVEELVGAGLPVVVIDPVGVWFGLRSSADGKSAGLGVTILGGEHGDVPLEEGAGAVIADFVIEAQQPCVIDLSLLRKGQQVRFMTDFAERLYHAKATHREALHVVVDEADAFAPQRPQPNEARMLGAFEDLVRRGRSRGLGLTLITQRPASLNKNVLSQAEVLVVFQMMGKHDRDAIDGWVKMNGDEEKRVDLMKTMASLPTGTAWFWSPSWLDVFQKVPVRRRWTFDSSATPKAGAKRIEPKVLAPVDLEALRGRIASTIERAKADDPKALRTRIKELEAAKSVERVEVPIIYEPVMVAIAETLHEIDRIRDALAAQRRVLVEALAQSEVDGAKVREKVKERVVLGMQISASKPLRIERSPAPTANGTPPATNGSVKLRAGERRILEVLARHHPTKLTRSQLGALTGIAGSGTTMGTYRGVLARHGLIDVAGELVGLTAAGLSTVGTTKRKPMTRAEIVAVWKSALRAGERNMLDAVLSSGGEITRDELGTIVDIDPHGTTFGTYLGVLKRNDLVLVQGAKVRLGTALAEAS